MGNDTDTLAEHLAATDLAADALEGERLRNVLKARLLDLTVPDTKIDRFVVLAQIGIGGMGVVYAAYDPELDRKVAIKLVRTWGAHKRVVDQERLLREARSLARLSHPNVVAVYEVGLRDEDVFIAMEFVRGKTLREQVGAEGTPWRETVRAYLQAGEGLAAAHAVGLVHRDFKPDNAIVGDDGRVRVVDFGIARGEGSEPVREVSTEERGPATPLTVTGTVLGTPAYMAPEQRNGIGVVPRSDQFSFCAALHEALVGMPPGHEDAEAAMRTRGRKLPARLRRAIARGLAPVVDDRFVDMPALLAELRATLEGGRRLFASASLAVVIGMVASAAWFGWFRREEPCPDPTADLDGVWSDEPRAALRGAADEFGDPARANAAVVERELDRYATEWVAARRDACEAHWVRRTDSDTLFDRRMRCLDRDRHAMNELVQLLREHDLKVWQRAVGATLALAPVEACADVEALADEVPWPEDPEAVAAIESVGESIVRVETLERLGRLAQARPLAEATVQDALRTGHRRTEAEALAALAMIEDIEGRDSEAATLLEDAVWRAEAGRADEVAADLLARQMALAVSTDRIAEAVALERRVGGALERLGRPTRVESQVLHARFQLARAQGDLAAAEAHARAGIATAERMFGKRSVNVAFHMNNLGIVLNETGRWADAEQMLMSAIEIRLESQDATHPDVIGTRLGLAAAQYEQGRLAESQIVLESIVRDGDRAFTGPSPLFAIALVNLAILHTEAGRNAQASELVERAIRIIETVEGPNDPGLLNPLMMRAVLDKELGHRDQARAGIERALAIADRVNPDHAFKALLWTTLGNIELDAGDLHEARRHFRAALALQTRVRGEDHYNTGRAAYSLADADLAVGADEDAIAHARQALPILEASGVGERERLARTRFVLAQALMRESPTTARTEALAAARAAEEGFESLGKADLVTEIRTWRTNLDPQ